jgi:acyl homoserine lactone synthase
MVLRGNRGNQAMIDPLPYRAIITSNSQNAPLVERVQRCRKHLFVDKLGWPLSTKDGRECDQFDTDDAVHAALFEASRLIGTFRAIRTDREYLSQVVFPHLASLRPFPKRRDVWEISRLGVFGTGRNIEGGRITYGLMLRFAQDRSASALVAVVDLAHERFLSILGIRTRRYGAPVTIGTTNQGEPIVAVAGEIPIAEQAGPRFRALMAEAQQIRIDDETLVLGRRRVSA